MERQLLCSYEKLLAMQLFFRMGGGVARFFLVLGFFFETEVLLPYIDFLRVGRYDVSSV